MGKKTVGFGSEIKLLSRQQDIGEVLKQVMPQDLVKFGLIPELIGRLASIVTLNALNEDMLVDILTQPKNALVKQYARLFEIDGVELNFEPEAVRAIAKKAISRKTGARGLRSIIEEALTQTMFELPSMENISKCVVTEQCITEKQPPLLEKAKARKKDQVS